MNARNFRTKIETSYKSKYKHKESIVESQREWLRLNVVEVVVIAVIVV